MDPDESAESHGLGRDKNPAEAEVCRFLGWSVLSRSGRGAACRRRGRDTSVPHL